MYNPMLKLNTFQIDPLGAVYFVQNKIMLSHTSDKHSTYFIQKLQSSVSSDCFLLYIELFCSLHNTFEISKKVTLNHISNNHDV